MVRRSRNVRLSPSHNLSHNPNRRPRRQTQPMGSLAMKWLSRGLKLLQKSGKITPSQPLQMKLLATHLRWRLRL